MKVLVFTSRFPFPLERGDKLRIYHQMKQLAVEHEVHLITLSADREVDLQALDFLASVHTFQVSKVRQVWNLAKCLFGNKPLQVAINKSLSIKKKVEQLIEKMEPDHIYCQLARMAPYVIDSQIPKTLDYMDAFGLSMYRRASVAKGIFKYIYRSEAKRMIAYEKEVYHYFDNHTIISQQDAEKMDFPAKMPLEVVPNGIDFEYFSSKEKTGKYQIGFVGNMGYLPNIQAVEFIAHELIPSLAAETTFYIAGARPHARVKNLASDQVVVSGWLEDIRNAYEDIKILVAPIWTGTGQQNKILEAMAMGVPCITTKEVNNAIGAKEDEEILLAFSKEDFQQQIEKLLAKPQLYHRISKNALTFVKQNYDWQACTGKLLAIFRKNDNE